MCQNVLINTHLYIILWERAWYCSHCCGCEVLDFSFMKEKKRHTGLGEGLVTLLLMLRGRHFGQESERIRPCCTSDTELTVCLASASLQRNTKRKFSFSLLVQQQLMREHTRINYVLWIVFWCGKSGFRCFHSVNTLFSLEKWAFLLWWIWKIWKKPQRLFSSIAILSGERK